jgi:hypothetical protein
MMEMVARIMTFVMVLEAAAEPTSAELHLLVLPLLAILLLEFV